MSAAPESLPHEGLAPERSLEDFMVTQQLILNGIDRAITEGNRLAWRDLSDDLSDHNRRFPDQAADAISVRRARIGISSSS